MGKRIVVGFLVGLALLVVLDALAARLGLAPGAIPKIAGPSLWLASRAAGVTAFVALTLDVVFGLFMSTGAIDRWVSRKHSLEVHRFLSSATLALTAGHALALLGDRFVRFDVLDVLVPFLSSYRSLAVGLGVLAAYGALLVHLSFALRGQIGPKTWRKLHYVSFAVYAGALTHGVLAGSDSGRLGMQVLYWTSGAVVIALLLIRGLGVRCPLRASGDGSRNSTFRVGATQELHRLFAESPPFQRVSPQALSTTGARSAVVFLASLRTGK